VKKFSLALIIFIIIIVLFNYDTIFSYLSLPKTYKIEEVEESVYQKKEGVILLNQSITYSPYEGIINFNIDDMEKVPKDFLICQVETDEGSFKFYSQDTGIVSRRIEDLDLVLDQLKENPFLAIDKEVKSSVKVINNGDIVKEGEPIFRMIDNLEGYIYFKIDDDFKNFINGKSIYLKIDTNGEIFKGEIVENDKFIKIRFNKFVEYFINTKAYVFDTLIYSGNLIKIPNKFVKKDGIDLREQDGLNRFIPFESLKYIKQNDYYIFPEIEENKIIFELVGKEIIS